MFRNNLSKLKFLLRMRWCNIANHHSNPKKKNPKIQRKLLSKMTLKLSIRFWAMTSSILGEFLETHLLLLTNQQKRKKFLRRLTKSTLSAKLFPITFWSILRLSHWAEWTKVSQSIYLKNPKMKTIKLWKRLISHLSIGGSLKILNKSH